jgi:hypothetical protein
MIAQRRVENSFKLNPPGNNPMNIKGKGDAGQVEETTHEEIKGKRIKVKAKFAAFSSVEAGFSGYLDLLHRNYSAAYSDLTDETKTITDFATDLQTKGKFGAYATDGKYVQKVVSNFNSTVNDYTRSTTSDIMGNIKSTGELTSKLIGAEMDVKMDAGQRLEIRTRIQDQEDQLKKLFKNLEDLAKIK